MNCQILRTLYVKANGLIPCEDNRGEWVTLGEVSLDPDWSIATILDGPRYRHLRNSFADGKLPWPDVCEKCALIRHYEDINDRLADRHIEKLQIETALTCTLRCPCCSSLGQLKLRARPYVMNLGVFRRLLESCSAAKYKIDFIEYCGQGEPLTHPRFAEFVRTAREIYPATRQRLVTNANYDYAEKLRGEHVDEIYVSCDGVFQASYEKYRRGGSVAKALKFMRDAAALSQAKRPLVVWKYILFEFNDSEKELKAAQDFALEADVGMLMFILTQTEFGSRRYTTENYPEILLQAPNARLSMTPDFLRDEANSRPARTFAIDAGGTSAATCCHVDHIGIYPGVVTIQGWAVTYSRRDAVVEVTVRADGEPLGSARLGVQRPEVTQHLNFAKPDSGFVLASRWPFHTPHPSRIDIEVKTRKGKVNHYAWSALRPGTLEATPPSTPAAIAALRELLKLAGFRRQEARA